MTEGIFTDGDFDGIRRELRGPANAALNAIDLLHRVGRFEHLEGELAAGIDAQVRDDGLKALRIFRAFSGPDVDGMGEFRSHLLGVYRDYEDAEIEFREALRISEDWRGVAGIAARRHIDKLQKSYEQGLIGIGHIMSGIVAVQDAIHVAREDLSLLAESFYEAAEEYRETRSQTDVNYAGRIAGNGIGGALTAILMAPKNFTIAGVAASAVGVALTGELSSALGSVSGGDPDKIIDSFFSDADLIRTSLDEVLEPARESMTESIGDLSPVPRVPDAGFGPEFQQADYGVAILSGLIGEPSGSTSTLVASPAEDDSSVAEDYGSGSIRDRLAASPETA
ncbi:hypothetical protein FHR81_003446 [Actinoalloteichus hoggarensis]|uniref:Uncharacterized protein n=1 Tax=Actinoalloteichus hoggarensis TaxID=1470176 RepID=A0A221W8X5_9PSEU|nr:hypothetical protein [Actinoalloteichus hoggarensis]ASO21797.1 hypothetical protein AHOG_20900 [Actinoalloteichus hoggarensis]MBB5922394.1 hypothetical protein [Actinoalloteichus hoggarensis]